MKILICFSFLILISSVFAAEQTQFKQPSTLKELLALPPADLDRCDLARMNLLCAEGLPGSEDLKIDDTLATLDSWAQHVKSETDRNFHHFQENPKQFNNSEAYYRALLLITVVQQDFNVHYNPAHITTPDAPEPDNTFFADSKDLFLHGLVSSRAMGTCISMPVFYVAIGQRLGYYSPSTGRWLSRDPNGEPGFELLRSASAVPRIGQIVSAASLPPGRLFARDIVETKREPNRYDFVANSPITTVDLFGLRTIHVGNCEVIVAYGHGDTGNPHKFKFDGPCSAGWFLGCYSKETDDLLNYPHNIPGAASISDEYDFAFDGYERLKRDFKTTWDAALVKAVKMCKLCKCICPKITVKAVKIDKDPTLPWYGDDYPDATILCQ